MKVLIVGSGGREHALAWKVRQSPLVSRVLVAPGNAGTELEKGVENVDIGAEDIPSLLAFAEEEQIELTIVGPEVPLVMGIVDMFKQHGLVCFGPDKKAAQLEGSKTFAKNFLKRYQIPTAQSESFTDIDQAINYIERNDVPIVIKADGLAAGKGVVIAQDKAEGVEAVRDMLADNKFGEAGSCVVIEEFLRGEEASFICMVDGENILPMASSQDHKAAHDGDTGPNTGGMGAYSPAPVVDQEVHEAVMRDVILPTVRGMSAEGASYTGFLYAGLMIGEDRIPKVLEFNCRFGDPETQPVMMRLKSDLVAHCLAAINGELDQQTATWDERSALGVVLAVEGYPDSYEKGKQISGAAEQDERDINMKLFHAGTKLEGVEIVTSGGRVMCATALGVDIKEAQTNAYLLARSVSWEGCWYRSDIGYRGIDR